MLKGINRLKKPFMGQSLAEKNPKAVLEWDYEANYPLTPKDVCYGTTFKVNWICSKGHKYDMSVNARTSPLQSGCPYCSCGGNRVWEGNCLAIKNPKIAKEWHPTKNGKLTPFNVTASSVKEVWWKCKKGHEWLAVIEHRNKGGRKCFFCNSLAYVNPKIAKEWHPTKNRNLTPFNVSCNSGRKVWWKCPICKHSWVTTISHRNDKKNSTGCPSCHKEVILKDGTDWDSYIEAFYYLLFKKSKVKFKSHGRYGGNMGNSKYDFYIPECDLYIEVTSYDRKSMGWKEYSRKIKRKRDYVNNILKKNFRFIQRKLTGIEINLVRNNMRVATGIK